MSRLNAQVMLFDSHCHPQFSQYDQDREEVIKRTLATGCGMICVGTDLEMSKKAVELAEKYNGPPSPDGFGRASIWATVGLHPHDAGAGIKIKDYEELVKHPKVVAIGEAGLDYYRTEDQEARIRQQEIFRQFLGLAVEIKKPAIIHCRNAYDDTLEILKNNPVAGVIHSFTGDFNLAGKFLDLGYCLGLNGIITFLPSRKAMEGQAPTDLEEAITNIPLDRILLETDAPYLAPVPYRGKRNEPLYVEFVARRIAEIKNMSFEEVANQTTKNAEKLFGIDSRAS